VRAFRCQQSAWIFDPKGINTERNDFPRLFFIVTVCVDRADSVDHMSADKHPGRFGGLDRMSDVADIVERIIGRQPFHAISGRSLQRQPNNIIGKELEGEEALTAGPNVERRRFQFRRGKTHPLPGIFTQVAHAHIEDGATNKINPREAHAIHARKRRQQHGIRHPRRP